MRHPHALCDITTQLSNVHRLDFNDAAKTCKDQATLTDFLRQTLCDRAVCEPTWRNKVVFAPGSNQQNPTSERGALENWEQRARSVNLSILVGCPLRIAYQTQPYEAPKSALRDNATIGSKVGMTAVRQKRTFPLHTLAGTTAVALLNRGVTSARLQLHYLENQPSVLPIGQTAASRRRRTAKLSCQFVKSYSCFSPPPLNKF